MQNDKSDSVSDKTTDLRDKKSDKPKKSEEIGGRKGPDPVRYGDWENNGIASDF